MILELNDKVDGLESKVSRTETLLEERTFIIKDKLIKIKSLHGEIDE